MKRSITLSSICVSAMMVHAQPVLTFASNAPVPGTSYELHYSPYVSPGEPGSDQSWNLSTLGTDSIHQIALVQPASTEHGASFPGSTVAETGAMAAIYFRAANDGMYLVGSESDDLLIVYGDQGKYLPFPCGYQSTWTDDVSAQFTSEGVDVFRTGTITGEVDGYGTVTMPYGDVPNALRVHWHEETVDSTAFFTFTSIYDSYLYFVSGQSYPVAQLVSTTTLFMDQSVTTEYAQWVGSLSTGVDVTVPTADRVDLFPVPASGTLNIGLPSHFSGTPLITITDAAGRTIHTDRTVSFAGMKGRMDVADLPPGTYQLIAIDEQGQRATRGFIVQ